jgi:hypothetical protein
LLGFVVEYAQNLGQPVSKGMFRVGDEAFIGITDECVVTVSQRLLNLTKGTTKMATTLLHTGTIQEGSKLGERQVGNYEILIIGGHGLTNSISLLEAYRTTTPSPSEGSGR